jgi:hypothetical protein
MNIDEILAVSGLPGLYRILANRHNGLVVEDLETKTKRFCSVRKHQFTPLGSVAIYRELDTIQLTEIFKRMHEQREDLSIPSMKNSSQEIMEYFEEIVPDYDRDRVHISDMKKVIKWYTYLSRHDILNQLLDLTGTDEEE